MAKHTMTRSGWIWIFVVIVIIVASVLIYFYFKNKNTGVPKSKNNKPIKKPTTPPPPGVPKWIPEKFPLNVGMYGAYIQQLQAAVGVDQDQKLGPITKAAVLAKGYNIPLYEPDYNKLAIIGQPIYAYSDGILLLADDFATSIPANVKTDDFLGNIVGISGASYLVNPATSNPPINATGNIYVQKSDVYFGDLNKV